MTGLNLAVPCSKSELYMETVKPGNIDVEKMIEIISMCM